MTDRAPTPQEEAAYDEFMDRVEDSEQQHTRKGKVLGFAKLKGQLGKKKGVKDPAALAAAIGTKKYGKAGMAKKAAAGKAKAAK